MLFRYSPLEAVLRYFFYIVLTTHLLPVCFLLTELAAPPRVDGGLELLQSGGQH